MLKTHCPRIVAACTIALLTVAAAQPVQAENWTYRADLGGWKDNDTGLVWGPSSPYWSSYSYNYYGAIYDGIPAYQQLTGISKWRLPTLAEAQTAYAHNAITYFQQTWPGGAFWMWMSDMKGKKQAWTMSFVSGKSQLWSVNSATWFRPVYRP